MKVNYLLFTALFLISFQGFTQKLTTYDLSLEHKINPLGIDNQNPRFSWKIKGSGKNIMQTSYQIQVASSGKFINIIWDSGETQSDKSILVAYEGPKLKSKAKYYWRVKVKDNHKHTSSWSETAHWQMGMLSTSDWTAKWIEPQQDTIPNGPALLLRNEFNLESDIVSATAFVTAHGLYELYINGKKAGDEVFTPGWTVYEKRLQYQVFDVTDALTSGQNCIAAALGDGWFRGHLAWKDNWGVYGKKLGLLCQIEVTFSNGQKTTIITDDNWKGSSEGPITLNSIYNGESYDARKELKNWSKPGFNDQSWKSVTVSDYALDNLIATETVPVRKIQELKPVKIWKTPKGTLVADMGQNMVGWVKLKTQGPAGKKITLQYAEVMDKNGEFYTDNLRSARATSEYILKGEGEEVYEPKFTFFGFRYVSVEGFPGELSPEDLTGIVIHSDMKPTGSFECDEPLINQLQSNIQWGQKGNFLDIPTDCPQRDERLGWTGDAQAFVSTAAYNMDVAAFFTKWLKDLSAEQYENGCVPVIIPNVINSKESSPGWGDAATIVPWTLFQVYGDKRLLAEQYTSMKAYTDYTANRGEVSWKGFGDWLYYKPEMNKHGEPDGHTSKDLIIQAFIAYSASIVAEAAKVLGKTEDVAKYQKLFEDTKASFIQNYVTPAGRISSDSQTSYVLALMFNLLPEKLVPEATNHLVKNIKSRGNHLSTGFLGTPYLCKVLSDQGKTDVAYDLLLQKSFPSWLYPVTMGATTIWERWDGQKPDSTFQDVGMNSFNHYAYGAIGDWMYKVVAGLDIGAPGYKKVLIQPQPDKRLQFAKASIESGHGKIRSEWKFENEDLLITAEIPANTTAQITLPQTTIDKVVDVESGKKISEVYENIKSENTAVVLNVGSGIYQFKCLKENN
ncbi:alpha-L-rhamnosidase [Flexithrix dorotheae]|uniref:alpha-L-rhamnosidase n=1 Tax=Flexithrix dorotheae TaxID=70993 RepID=UPI000377A851|nr:alpha-L-rhamnosidase [Flexithrix dorotheae]